MTGVIVTVGVLGIYAAVRFIRWQLVQRGIRFGGALPIPEPVLPEEDNEIPLQDADALAHAREHGAGVGGPRAEGQNIREDERAAEERYVRVGDAGDAGDAGDTYHGGDVPGRGGQRDEDVAV